MRKKALFIIVPLIFISFATYIYFNGNIMNKNNQSHNMSNDGGWTWMVKNKKGEEMIYLEAYFKSNQEVDVKK